MKKAFIFIIALLAAAEARVQETSKANNKRSFLSFHAGVSIPIMCYASTDINNRFAGFAKMGFMVDMSYGYRIGQFFGVAGTVFYSTNKTDTRIVQHPTGAGNGRYQYYGIMAGPMLTKNFSEKLDGDFKFLAGIARAHAPKLVHQGETILNKDQSFAVVWNAGASLRYSLSDKTFLSFKVEHTQLKPKFEVPAGENAKGEQHIVVINTDVGFGIKF